MSRGKYSPNLPRKAEEDFGFNCYKQRPAPWAQPYDEKTMFANYDAEGFDSYGYSAFNADGSYAGIGSGVDRNGITEHEYLCMSDEDFEAFL